MVKTVQDEEEAKYYDRTMVNNHDFKRWVITYKTLLYYGQI